MAMPPDFKLDADGNLVPHASPRRSYVLPPRVYAILKGRTYPAPFRYLASWLEARRKAR